MIIDFIIRSHLVYVRYLVECSDALNEQFNSVGEHMFTTSQYPWLCSSLTKIIPRDVTAFSTSDVTRHVPPRLSVRSPPEKHNKRQRKREREREREREKRRQRFHADEGTDGMTAGKVGYRHYDRIHHLFTLRAETCARQCEVNLLTACMSKVESLVQFKMLVTPLPRCEETRAGWDDCRVPCSLPVISWLAHHPLLLPSPSLSQL